MRLPAKQDCHVPSAAPDFRERAAIFDRTARGALSTPHTSRAPGFATQDHAQARDSNAAQSNTQDIEATSANLFRKECQGCTKARGRAAPPRDFNLPERSSTPSHGFSWQPVQLSRKIGVSSLTSRLEWCASRSTRMVLTF